MVGQTTLSLERNPERPARDAELSLKAMKVTLEVPYRQVPRVLEPIDINVILVEETAAPAGQSPVRWRLLTILPIETFEDVWRCVVWYSYRWLIERFHFTLKSGCRFEDLQLQSRERLMKALPPNPDPPRLTKPHPSNHQTPNAPNPPNPKLSPVLKTHPPNRSYKICRPNSIRDRDGDELWWRYLFASWAIGLLLHGQNRLGVMPIL